MMQKLGYLPMTPSQTGGPYVHIGTTPEAAGLDPSPFEQLGKTIFEGNAKGERIALTGRVIDGHGAALTDVMLEIWQADANGLYAGQEGADPAFYGFARRAVDFTTGAFRFETIKPGAVKQYDGSYAPPHVTFWLSARGINTGLHTRMYFPEDDLSGDALLARVQHKDRLKTLIAEKTEDGYRFDIRLQGDDETIFFDI
ncbi:protocatechuate 3,4-dioxygenase subunit alpha [Qingshengfaniella alkalisoli]|uniref:Protocatechuate 3,4-dioxygenase subunit alpha n=1 Tax=Qingshengfaniella alkalisoli TaxID=2599296 RepID=A0A5B8J3L9_9RHOB|nr:protocatechuate 3,4-dioxygenase subunit alpha [Qingshengfaniella alkalisoli]QDY69087.1 protocatechuate 3,4-dioxygenase subunit alpha [Qingshengfaniella alkalisoli]